MCFAGASQQWLSSIQFPHPGENAPRLQINLRWISVTINRFGINVADADAGVRFFPWSSLGFDLATGVSAFKVDVGPRTNGTPSLTATLKYSLATLRAGVAYSF